MLLCMLVQLHLCVRSSAGQGLEPSSEVTVSVSCVEVLAAADLSLVLFFTGIRYIHLLCSGTNGSTFLLRSASTMQAAFIGFTCTLQLPHQRQRKLCRLCSPYSWRCHPRSRTLGHRLGTRTCHNILHPYSLSFSQPLSLLLLLIFVNVVDHGLREILSLMSSTQFFIPWGDILFVL